MKILTDKRSKKLDNLLTETLKTLQYRKFKYSLLLLLIFFYVDLNNSQNKIIQKGLTVLLLTKESLRSKLS